MYAEMLSQMIKKSGMTLAEIVKRCWEEHGVWLTHPYLSKLQTGEQDPALEPTNRAIAAVCGGDPDALQYAASYDRSPPEIRAVIDALVESVGKRNPYDMPYVIKRHHAKYPFKQSDIDKVRKAKTLIAEASVAAQSHSNVLMLLDRAEGCLHAAEQAMISSLEVEEDENRRSDH